VGNLDVNQPAFSVNRFENRDGIVSWRVDGRLNCPAFAAISKRKMKPAAEKAALDIKAAQLASGRLNEVATALNAEQVHDAGAAFRRIEGRSLSRGEAMSTPRTATFRRTGRFAK